MNNKPCSIQLHCICIALNHRFNLKGIKRQYIYDTPLALAPQRARIRRNLISKEEIL